MGSTGLAQGSEWFRDRTLVLTTKHRKEQVIAPLMESEVGVRVIVPTEFDTDQFGTFTRDVPRPATQVETARLKATAALEALGETLAIASEGFFGPHPAIPYLPCNRELVVLVDRQHGLEIVGEALSTETNYRHQVITSLDEAIAFAGKVGFPEHGLVVLPDPAGQPEGAIPADLKHAILKGITTGEALEAAVKMGMERSPNGKVQIETDMRAMHNPTRMRVIHQATLNLVQKIHRTCPSCGTPGFDITQRRPGLPCGLCTLPTTLTLAVVYTCQRCNFTQASLYPDGIQQADPGHCEFCNP